MRSLVSGLDRVLLPLAVIVFLAANLMWAWFADYRWFVAGIIVVAVIAIIDMACGER